jgi:peptidoglycan/xylan/chitin deacetylase (PgdA/CDA1 family)
MLGIMKFLNIGLVGVAFFLCSMTAHAVFIDNDEFPEDRTYVPLRDTGFGQYAARSIRGSNKVALTFDDGPSPALTPLLLDILKKYNVKATFFMMGQNITTETYPIIERALREGHLIGAHSMHHSNSNGLSEARFKEDTAETFKRLQIAQDRAGVIQNEVYYRFPFGNYGRNSTYHHINVLKEISEEIYQANCINFAFWSVDSSDWVKGMTPSEVYENVMASFDGGPMTDFVKINGKYQKRRRNATRSEITRGGVILFHDIHTPSIEAMPKILETFKQRHIEVVPLNSIEEYDFKGRECGSKLSR